MRVALVSPPYGNGSSNSMRPLGLVAIHSFLEARLAGRAHLTLFDHSDCAPDDFTPLDALSEHDVVGVCSYSTNFPIVLEWARQLKRRRPGVVLVVGGPHATAVPRHIAEVHRSLFDYVVRGEGERPMAAIVEALLDAAPPPRVPGVLFWDSQAGEVVAVGSTDPVPDLDSVPVPVADMSGSPPSSLVCFDRRENRLRKAFPFTTSRGCPFSCTFCSIRASNSKWRAVSAARLGTWISAALEREPDIEHINFMDADFLINRARVIAIGEMFQRLYPNLTWSFSGRVDDLARLGEPALKKLATQGLIAVEVGFESGSQAMLDRLGKGVQVRQNYEAVAMLERAGLDMLIDFILFVPDETPEQLKESLTFLRKAGLTDYLPHDHFFTYLVQYPGTPLRSFTEKLFGLTFSLDVLPEPDELFAHPGTRQIFRHFVREFQPMALRLEGLIRKVDAAALRLASAQPRVAQLLRLESISLRHLPYLVLETLIESHDAPSLLEAVPWLGGFDAHVEELLTLCRDSDHSPQILEGAPGVAA